MQIISKMNTSGQSILELQPPPNVNSNNVQTNEPTTSTTMMTTTRKKMYTTVPISRVNAIMRSCPNLTTVKNDAIALTSQAAELFIQDLVRNSYNLSGDKSYLTYNTLANFIAQSDYTFLRDAIPQKITVSQYRELKKQMDEDNSS